MSRPQIRTAMVLAAGLGTRLRPLTDVLPKPLCEIAGLPLIRLALRQLGAAGVERAVINLHHLGPRIRAELGDTAEGVTLAWSLETTILGTGGGLARALPQLGPEPFFVVNADALQDVDLAALAEAHQRSGALATLALREDPAVLKYGPIGVDDTGRIRRLVDAFDDGGATRLLMFTGVHLVHPRAVAHLAADRESCVIRQGYAHHLRAGAHLGGYVHTGAFHDVGTPERWAGAQAAVLGGRHGAILARATRGAEQAGVHVLAGARVDPSATLRPPCVIQAGAQVDGGATVGPHAAVGVGGVVGAGARVERAAVLAGAQVQPGEAVLDRVRAPSLDLAWPYPAT